MLLGYDDNALPVGGTVIHKTFHVTYKAARRIAIAVVGGTIVLLGIVMIVTPGPGLFGIAVGLTILAIEFTWARRWLKRLRETISDGMANNRARRAENHRKRVDN
ncbi:MAG: hypothetical protein GTO71_05320 [Woeseiaceae bacterium]|nr:hypothetical protein [Woeseiaceae bacterium]NIP20518.1 hypothetical protein [Woeseiaceae bacterium]NIS89112.1 hypothetical protein [Woeseiaceae bacterium]